jgi:chromate transporter
MTNFEASPPPLSLLQLFLRFLRFGFLRLRRPGRADRDGASGAGRGRALGSARALQPAARGDAGLCPGPEAHELCVHLGMVARGRIGGLLAGLGFMLPGFVLMLGAAWLYKDWIVGNAAMAPVFLGVQIAVLAIILRAVQRIGAHILEDKLLWLLAAAALGATLAGCAVLDSADRGGIDLQLCCAARRGCRGVRRGGRYWRLSSRTRLRRPSISPLPRARRASSRCSSPD